MKPDKKKSKLYNEGLDDPSIIYDSENNPYSGEMIQNFIENSSSIEQNNRHQEIREFKTIMSQLYGWSIRLGEDEIRSEAEIPLSPQIQKELIDILGREMEEEYNEEEDDAYIEQKINDYTYQTKKELDKPLMKFWLELKQKYKPKEDEYGYKLYPLLYITNINKFIALLKEIEDDGDHDMIVAIRTIMYGLKEQLIQWDEWTIKTFEVGLPLIYNELHRTAIYYDLRDDFDSIIFTAAEKWYLKELIDLRRVWFNISHRDREGINIDYQTLPTFLQDIIDLSLEEDMSDIDKQISFSHTKE